MSTITYQVTKTAVLNAREAALLISVGSIGGPATALQTIKAAHENPNIVDITHSEIYALAKRLIAKGLMTRGEEVVWLHGEKLTRVVFNLTTPGKDCYAQATPCNGPKESADRAAVNQVAVLDKPPPVPLRSASAQQHEFA